MLQGPNASLLLETCKFSFAAVSFGDPHFITLDGLHYTFNPIGEFWLINTDTILIQARTIQAWDVNNKPQQASVFGAVAARDDRSSQIHVQLTDNRKGKMIKFIFSRLYFNFQRQYVQITVRHFTSNTSNTSTRFCY